jgi:transcriptional regulator with XRE-family HTH domain
MKTDHEVRRMINERKKGKTQEQAAARSGMSVRTVRKYERLAQLPSHLKKPRGRTRPNPFEQDWPWVQAQLERDGALQVKMLFDELCLLHPGRYQPVQLRTLQRHVALWRASSGPAREVIFEQVHQPGRLGQSDFTHIDDLAITIAGAPFPHLLYHFVLTYSNVEAVHLCFSESFEALAEGLESCLWQLGGVPQQHRTDNLSAAVVRIERGGDRHYTERVPGADGPLSSATFHQHSRRSARERRCRTIPLSLQTGGRSSVAPTRQPRLCGATSLSAFSERPGPFTQSDPPATLERGTRAPVALADHAARPGSGTARECQSLFDHPGLAQYLGYRQHANKK